MQDIEKGNHDEEECEKDRKRYKLSYRQEVPNCEYKENKSKIQKLLGKVQIDANGIVTEIQFDNKKNDEEMNVLEGKIKTQSDANGSATETQPDNKKYDSTDLIKMIHALKTDLFAEKEENIDEKWLESLQSMESHYIKKNGAKK